MDGFAVRVEDTPGRLPVVERIAAGRPATRPLEAGQAMAIATGGVVPEGADAVVPIERVVEDDDAIEIAGRLEHGEHVRPRGGDLAAGDLVVRAGTLVRPAELGALAAAGVDAVSCARRPRAAVVSTGTELRLPGESLEPGQIFEANGVMLAAALASAGAVVAPPESVPDDEDAHRAALERGLGADVLVTSGGVSVGPHDLVRTIEAELGRRGGLLEGRRQAGEAGLVRRAGRHARVRAAREPRLVARLLRAVRAARRCARFKVHASPGRRSLQESLPPPCGGTPSATSSYARASGSTETASCSSRSPGRSRT